jgi:1,4-dihydroxy-2-naphthoate octaprenyltransferase
VAAVGETTIPPPSGWRLWLDAVRPRTLPAAVGPIAVATAIALREGTAHAPTAALALATALLLQILSNLANDVFDFERGADGGDRLGPARVTQRGLVSPKAMRRATAVAALLAAAAGVALVWRGGWPIALAGGASLAAAILYTGGPWPLAYRGLGDIAVFVFFGGVAVVGGHYVQALQTSPAAWAAAVPVGLLATAILAVNNLRDRESDARAGKRTLAVRLSKPGAQRYTAGLVVAAPVALVAFVAGGALPPGALAALATAPWLVGLVRELATREGAALNPLLAATARRGLVFSLALAAGVLL